MSDLSELFARDPLKLTREDINAMVQRLRAAREQFAAAPQGTRTAAGKMPNAAKEAEKKAAAAKALSDLGL